MSASFSNDNSAFTAPAKITNPLAKKAHKLPNGSNKVTLKLTSTPLRKGRFVKIQLHFLDKWILLSEIRFDSLQESGNLTAKEATKVSGSEDERVDEKMGRKEGEEVVRKDVKKEASNIVSKDEKEVNSEKNDVIMAADNPSPPVSSTDQRSSSNSDSSQIYIGLVIGVLGVTVVLLLATIMIMLRRNKQKIFTKHSVFKSPLSDRHIMRNPELTTPLNSKIYEEAETLNSGNMRELNASIYQEPSYRLVLQRNINGYHRNNSCGRLCDYDEPGQIGSQAMSMMRLPDKNKFGSTPLFTVQNQIGGVASTTFVPPSFSCHEVKNNNNGGYATPTLTPGNQRVYGGDEGFYAATDILGSKVR